MSESKTQGSDTTKAVAGAINKTTGRVTVYDALTGEPSHVYPVDAKEIVASGCGLLTPPPPQRPSAESEPDYDPGGKTGENGAGQGVVGEGGENDAGAEAAPEVHTLTVEGSTPSPATTPKKKPGPKPKEQAPAKEGGA